MQITADQIRQVIDRRYQGQSFKPTPRADVLDAIARASQHWDLDTPIKVSHFISQGAHETGAFRWIVEQASGAAYEGRSDLGNTQPGDGPRFKGRCIFQLTGRFNYRIIGQDINKPLEANPTMVEQPDVCVETALAYWKRRVAQLRLDDHVADVEAVTRAINGGMNGFDDRLAWYRAARFIWRDDFKAPTEPPTEVTPVPEPPLAPPELTIQDLVDELFAKTNAAEINLTFKRSN